MVRDLPDGVRGIGRMEEAGLTVDTVERPSSGTGKAILVDDLEATLFKWTAGARDTTRAYRGEASMKITDQETQRWFAMRPSKKIGFEVMWLIREIERLQTLFVGLTWYDGNYVYDSRIRYYAEDLEWRYYNEYGAWVLIPGSTQPRQYMTSVWHSLKEVVDFAAEKYALLVVNEDIFDLSDFAFKKEASTINQHARARISVTPLATMTVDGFFDDVVLTEED